MSLYVFTGSVHNIDGGYFIHKNQFDIQPEDYDLIREYLMQTCMDIPVNIDTIYEDFSEKFPDFLYRNDFDDKSEFFAALNYMFREEFRFTKPYIARIGSHRRDITRRSITLQHIKSFDTIEIENLVDICNENNIRYASIANLVLSLAPDYIRISRTKLMKQELTGITDEIIDQVVNIVKELIETNGYIAGSKVTDFLWFPEINVDWNKFLLENLILQSKKIDVISFGGRDSLKYINSIYVSDVYRTKSYEAFLVEILRDEVNKGVFTSKAEMRDWLKEEGLIEVNMPNFLESTEYFYVDKTGVHCKKE